jgi:hypothetical protein
MCQMIPMSLMIQMYHQSRMILMNQMSLMYQMIQTNQMFRQNPMSLMNRQFLRLLLGRSYHL